MKCHWDKWLKILKVQVAQVVLAPLSLSCWLQWPWIMHVGLAAAISGMLMISSEVMLLKPIQLKRLDLTAEQKEINRQIENFSRQLSQWRESKPSELSIRSQAPADYSTESLVYKMAQWAEEYHLNLKTVKIEEAWQEEGDQASLIDISMSGRYQDWVQWYQQICTQTPINIQGMSLSQNDQVNVQVGIRCSLDESLSMPEHL